MKTFLFVTGNGSIVVLTTYQSVTDGGLLKKLENKGLHKFIAFEIPAELARDRYGPLYQAAAEDLRLSDDLYVLDFSGERAFGLFRFDELGAPVVYDAHSGTQTLLPPLPGAVTQPALTAPSRPWPHLVARPAGASRFHVMLIDLAGDDGERSALKRLATTLTRLPGIAVQRADRLLAVDDRGDPLEGIAAAVRTGRSWLRDAYADVAIWGRIAADGALRLKFLSAAVTPFGTVRTYRPPVDTLELPADAGADFAPIVYAAALAFVDPSSEEQARDLVALLAPAVEEGERVLPRLAGRLSAAALGRARGVLGMAWVAAGRSAHDADLLDKAIGHLREVLISVTRERDPELWAATQNILGNALRLQGEMRQRSPLLDDALTAYGSAQEVFQRPSMPLYWAMVENNRAAALAALGRIGADAAPLKAAVAAYRAALDVITRVRMPVSWAMTQNNLGIALRALGEKEPNLAVLYQAVEAHSAAAEVLTRVRLPLHWAKTQMHLGAAYQSLGERGSGMERLEQAIAAYNAALEVYSRERFPAEWAQARTASAPR